ncbi:MAG: hypothetical protein IPM18_07715 [Phycisphaerales bacterium]|nr:hypothetical protein [Phycisphaerales bacterium]
MLHSLKNPTSATRLPFNGYIVAVAMALLLVSSAGAQFVRLDDFEDELIGPIHGQDGWTSSGGDNRVEVDPAGGDNLVLCVPSESSTLRKALAFANLELPDGTVRMFFMRMRVAEKQTFSVGLSSSNFPSQYSDFATELGMANSSPNLDLRIWDDDGSNYQFLTQLQPDTWYSIWLRIDTALNRYEVWLTDRPGGFAAPEDKLSTADGDAVFEFRSGKNSPLRTFYIKTSGGGSGFGPAYFDDLYLEAGPALNLCHPVNPPTGDCDGDGLVGNTDWPPLTTCLSGPMWLLIEDCACFDTDCDTDVDLADAANFQVQYAGG